MSVTPVSMLERLKVAKPDAIEWQDLQEIYLPLILIWVRRVPNLAHEAEDLSQEVFLVVIRELPRFERQREGSFRAWLRRVTVNRVRDFTRQRRRAPKARPDETEVFLSQLEDPSSDLADQWDRQHDQHVFDKLLASIRPDFAASTWDAFQATVIEKRPAADVSAQLGTSVNAVLLAKSRVLKRLRAEAAGMVD